MSNKDRRADQSPKPPGVKRNLLRRLRPKGILAVLAALAYAILVAYLWRSHFPRFTSTTNGLLWATGILCWSVLVLLLFKADLFIFPKGWGQRRRPYLRWRSRLANVIAVTAAASAGYFALSVFLFPTEDYEAYRRPFIFGAVPDTSTLYGAAIAIDRAYSLNITGWRLGSVPYFLITSGFLTLVFLPPIALQAVAARWGLRPLRQLSFGWWVLIVAAVGWLLAVTALPGMRTYLYWIAGAGASLLLLVVVPKLQVRPLAKGGSRSKEVVDTENELRRTMAQLVGGAVLLIGVYYTAQNLHHSQRTLEATQEGQITERFSKAMELLGKTDPNDSSAALAARLGGIHALERIALDSQKDHWTIMEILSAYLRENATPEKYEQAKGRFLKGRKKNAANAAIFYWPPADVQEILLVIGRRGWRDTETDRLYLPRIKIGSGEVTETPLGGAYLAKALLAQSDLENAYLSGAILSEANLSEANLRGTILSGARLDNANMRGADLERADLTGADLFNADLTDAIGLTDEQVKSAVNYTTARLPPYIKVK